MSSNMRGGLINFEVYWDSSRLLGIADVELPDLKFNSVDIAGAGVAGKLDLPILGHTESIEIGLNWRTVNEDALKLARQTGMDLALYGANQNLDNSDGQSTVEQIKISVRGLAKTATLGKFEPASSTETKTVIEVIYLKIEVDGVEKLELDKLNFVYKVDGDDFLNDVRTALGITDSGLEVTAGF